METSTVLTPRDLELLHLVGRCGVLRTRDLARAFFGARATANDRLRKLYCHGYLACFSPDRTRDNLYALTPLGREQVLIAFDLDANALRVVTRLPKKLDHLTGVNEVRLHIALACRASSRYRLVSLTTDVDLARERHAALLDLIPDIRVLLEDRATGEPLGFFVEIDLGTESVTWLVRRKLALFETHARSRTPLYGLLDPLIVLVAPGLRRARNIARTLARLGAAPRVVFTLRHLVDERSVFGARYAHPGDLEHVADRDELLFNQRLLP